MEIKTKYNIGDEVWIMENNHIVKATIQGYNISYGVGYWFGEYSTGNPLTSIEYCLTGKDMIENREILSEEYLFPTKEELLKSL